MDKIGVESKCLRLAALRGGPKWLAIFVSVGDKINAQEQ